MEMHNILKIEAEGITTSFRYPHFMWQKQPTFEMPPPATIYGHICSAVGKWVDPTDLLIAYRFTYESKFEDLEHIWTYDDHKKKETVKIFRRELLFRPHISLYINKPDWESFFRSPVYTVVLGRSQDLFTYTNISVITPQQTDKAYFEHTLLPYSASCYTNRGYAVLMPRYLDYDNKRYPMFSRYFIIHDRIDSRQNFLWFGEDKSVNYWIDPTSPQIDGAFLGLAFLSFIGDKDETIYIS